jgi:ATP-dependent exoDNAse (exonuclease V) alpha subunit
MKGRPFREGDKVICRRNGWYKLAGAEEGKFAPELVCNGDLGVVEAFKGGTMKVRLFAPERSVIVPVKTRKIKAIAAAADNDRDDDDRDTDEEDTGCAWTLAYAVTGHKAQGSEWPLVFIAADPGGSFVASREWWYTAISRAQALCIIVGNLADVHRQCGRVSLHDRKTFLRELLTCP